MRGRIVGWSCAVALVVALAACGEAVETVETVEDATAIESGEPPTSTPTPDEERQDAEPDEAEPELDEDELLAEFGALLASVARTGGADGMARTLTVSAQDPTSVATCAPAWAHELLDAAADDELAVRVDGGTLTVGPVEVPVAVAVNRVVHTPVTCDEPLQPTPTVAAGADPKPSSPAGSGATSTAPTRPQPTADISRVCDRMAGPMGELVGAVQDAQRDRQHIATTTRHMSSMASAAIAVHDVATQHPALDTVADRARAFVDRVDGLLEGVPSHISPPYDDPAYDRARAAGAHFLDVQGDALHVLEPVFPVCLPDDSAAQRQDFLDRG